MKEKITHCEHLRIDENAQKKILLCKLKQQSKRMKVEIYETLLSVGFEIAIMTDECPFAGDGKNKCPYFNFKD